MNASHIFCMFLVGLVLMFGGRALGEDYLSDLADSYEDDGYEYGDGLLTSEELDDLLAPIALYPDPLIAQILPAATFVDQIDEAARYLRRYGKAAKIDSQPWDVSVKAVAHYPSVLYMMDRKYEWTVTLGQAFINQEQEVMDTIQRLRAEAKNAGSLSTTPQQQVVVEGDVIRIVPAQPDVIYIPEYDPTGVYFGSVYPSYGYMSFGIGFSMGVWLNRDCDWYGHRVYYHGWRGGGWINRTRPYVNYRNRTYVNNRHREIYVNRGVVDRNTTRYRSYLRRDAEYRARQGSVPRPPAAGTPQRRSRSTAPVPSGGKTYKRPAAPGGGGTNIYRGRQSRGGSTYQGFGGYGSSNELKTYRQRGRMSRGGISAPPPSVAPKASAPRAPAPRTSAPRTAPAPSAGGAPPRAPAAVGSPSGAGSAPGAPSGARHR